MGPHALKLALAPPAWRLLRAGFRTEARGVEVPAGPVIFACLHRDILPAIVHVKPWRPTLMVSDSPDGDILVRCLGRRDYGFVRGATGEGGGRAFVRLKRVLEEGGTVGLAVDGPVGPYGEIRDGALHLALRTGAPVLPLVARPGRALILRTWDRTVVPLPLTRVVVHASSPLTVADEEDFEPVRRRLAAALGTGEEGPCASST